MSFYKVKYTSKFLFLAFAFLLNFTGLFSQEYGLKFSGQSKLLDDRTGLNLFPKNLLSVNDNFEISFDIKIDFNQQEPLFGYVLRVINDKDDSVDLLVSPTKGRLNLVIGNSQTVLPIDIAEFSKDNWVAIKIQFLLTEGKIILKISDSISVKETIKFNKKDQFKILFGANNYKQFATSDVPDMSVRDVKIFQNNLSVYHYPLKNGEANYTLDKINKNKAITKNPNWLLQEHQIWKKNSEGNINGIQIATADEANGIIYLLSETAVTIYSVKNNSRKQIPYQDGAILLTLDHRAVFNKLENKIYCYLADKKLISILDLNNFSWNKTNTFQRASHQQSYQHHNSIFSDFDNAIYTFGGYGQYSYSNKVGKIDLKNKKWEDLPTNDSIFHPRYLSAIGQLNDTIYILGGYGSLSGNQMVNPKSYFDLFGYNIKTKKFFKKFEIPKLKDNMILANEIWIDSISRTYYALISDKTIFDGNLQLLKGSLDTPEAKIVGDKIPYKFLDVKTYSSLFFMPQQNKMYAYTSFTEKEVTTKTNYSIHSISYPAIPLKVHIPKKEEITSKSTIWPYVVGLCLLVFSFIGGYFFRQKIKRKKVAEEEIKNKEEKVDLPIEIKKDAPKEVVFSPVSNSLDYQIIFFGGFQIIDQNQNDITNKFSPLLKELFLLIWLYTFKNNKGISSAKLIEILWYDKPPRRAQNNRSVNITKLRGLLNTIGNCALTKETGYWKIEHNFKELKSDHYELIRITDSKNITKENMDHLIKITQKGSFLHNLNYEWLDGFKADISERIINALMAHIENVDIEKQPNFTVRLADCIFNFDAINEEAMMLKCKAQYAMGKHSLAENTFSKFTKEYRILYDQEYNYSFNEVLSKSI